MYCKSFNSWNIVEQLGAIKPFNLGINQDLFQNLSLEWALAIKFLHKPTLLLPPFQNIGRFDFSRFIYFAMYLDISYI